MLHISYFFLKRWRTQCIYWLLLSPMMSKLSWMLDRKRYSKLYYKYNEAAMTQCHWLKVLPKYQVSGLIEKAVLRMNTYNFSRSWEDRDMKSTIPLPLGFVFANRKSPWFFFRKPAGLAFIIKFNVCHSCLRCCVFRVLLPTDRVQERRVGCRFVNCNCWQSIGCCVISCEECVLWCKKQDRDAWNLLVLMV